MFLRTLSLFLEKRNGAHSPPEITSEKKKLTLKIWMDERKD